MSLSFWHMILPAWQRRCLASAAAGLVLLVTTAAALQVPAAHATDAEVLDISGAQQPGGRFLRLGLSKSAVIKLPADAKDVIVGDDAIVDVVLRNKKIAYLFARGAGQTNIFFFDGKGQELLHLDLEVTVDSKALKNLLDRSLPGNKIQIDSSGSNVILKGTVASAQDAKTAEDLANRFVNSSSSSRSSFSFFTFSSASTSPGAVLNLLKIAESDQVMLKVRVIELKREIIKRFGINLDANLGAGSLTSTPITPLDELGAGLSNAKIKLNAGGSSIDIQIKALEEQGLAKTLAEPTLTAVSGASANFLAGGEYPFRECEGNDLAVNCEIQFKPYGVSLAFTPTVLAENRIALNIATEVSEIGRQIFGIPAIETRKAQTSVEMPSGGSMMMAGLIKDVTKQDLKGTPGLKSLPVLGALFSSREYESNQTELVVIVTPYIAGPVDTNKLATPVDHYNNPTDLQQIFLGRLNRVYGVSGQTPASVYHGAVGHIVE